MNIDDSSPSEWYAFARYYQYVTTKPSTSYYYGCYDQNGVYREICRSKRKPIFKIKLFWFKLTHPKWKYK